MTAPTSPKAHAPADPNDLRTAIEELADEWAASSCSGLVEELRALLAAHPAQTPVRSGHDIACDADYLDASCICDEITPAPVSDTRREDVAAEAAWRASQEVNGFAEDQWKHVPEPQRASWRHIARAVLAALPAPPVVDEAEIEREDVEAGARAAYEFDRAVDLEFGRGDRGPFDTLPQWAQDTHREKMHAALTAIAARPRGATR